MKLIKHTVAPSNENQLSSAGFTLIELMVTVVVLAVIVGIAAPSISTQLANARVKSTTTTLASALAEARAESNIRRTSTTVSYVNGSQPNNNINIEVPYSGSPTLSSFSRPKDWTSLFFKSAVAGDFITGGNQGGGNGNGNQGGGNGNGNQGGGNGNGNQGGGNGNGNQGGGNGNGNQGGGNGNGNQGGGSEGGNQGGGNGNGNQGGGNGNGNQGGGSEGGNQGGGNEGGNQGGGNGSGNQNSTLVSIATYKYNSKSIIKSDPPTVTFRSQQNTDSAITYTICDANTSAKAMQVTVSSVGIITKKVGGSCTES